MSVPPGSEDITTDSVIDAIAMIELQRQDIKREADPEAWRNQALGKLQEILRQLEEALRLNGPNPEHQANAQAVRNAIGRLKTRSGDAGQRPKGDQPGGRPPHKPRPAQHSRRPPGRRGGR
jgi:hypothetical protein